MYILKYIYFTIILKPIAILLYYLVSYFSSPYVFINEKSYISCGSNRDVFYHPNDNKKIIKTMKKSRNNIFEKIWNANMENYRSYLFFGNMKYAPKNYGLINTNLGIGVVYELIKDYDNNISKNIKFYMNNNKISTNLVQQLIDMHNYYFINYDILIGVNRGNHLIQKISKDEFKIIIVDDHDIFREHKFCKSKDIVIKRVNKLLKKN